MSLRDENYRIQGKLVRGSVHECFDADFLWPKLLRPALSQAYVS